MAAGKSGLGLVPEFDLVVFTKLPAKQYDAALAHRRKIDQAPAVVLDLNAGVTELRDYFGNAVDGLNVRCPARDRPRRRPPGTGRVARASLLWNARLPVRPTQERRRRSRLV